MVSSTLSEVYSAACYANSYLSVALSSFLEQIHLSHCGLWPGITTAIAYNNAVVIIVAATTELHRVPYSKNVCTFIHISICIICYLGLCLSPSMIAAGVGTFLLLFLPIKRERTERSRHTSDAATTAAANNVYTRKAA